MKKNVAMNEINTGTYCFDNKALFDNFKKFQMIMFKGILLPDVIEILKNEGQIVICLSNR